MSKKRKASPATTPRLPLITLPRQVGHARARVSLDSPDSLFFGSFASVAAPDYEQEWRVGQFDDRTLDRIDTPELLLRLVDLSPEVALGLWNYLRFSNAGWTAKAYRMGGAEKVEDARAQAAVDAFLAQIKRLYGSVDVVLNRLYLAAFLRGAFLAELVLDAAGRVPVDLATPDPKTVQFEKRADPIRGQVFVPYQMQGGRRVYLDGETVRYVPLDPAPGSPFGRAIASPAVFACLFDMGLLRDLKRVVQQQGYPRLDIKIVGENLGAWVSPEVAADPEAMARHTAELIRQVETEYSRLAPEDAFVHTSAVELGRPVGAIDSSSLGAVDGLTRYLERKLVRAVKSCAFLFSLSESTTETQATRQYEAHQAGIQAGQHLCESLLEHMLTVALQVQGIQAKVEWRFAVVRASEMLRDTQVAEAKMRVAALGWALGYWSQDEAAAYATDKEKADVPEPRALPNTLSPVGEPEDPEEAQRPADEGPDDEEMDRARWNKFLRDSEAIFERWGRTGTPTNGKHQEI